LKVPARYSGYFDELSHCRICPRECKSDRFGSRLGWCKSDAGFNISSICIHKGEEPAISGNHGICNVFFSKCNLGCIYCQNWQISCRDESSNSTALEFSEVIRQITNLLDSGCHAVGFVSPSHYVPHVKAIIDALRDEGRNPVFVYNTNCYDKVETLRSLESYIDVYLPDFKYSDRRLAKNYSDASRYPEIALAALKEMYRQKGSVVLMDENGVAEKGIIIRHLVLPGNVENSIGVLRMIAQEVSTSLTISLMSQYWPTPLVKDHPKLGRMLSPDEYKIVADEMQKLGFRKGWLQEMDSHENYRPDFDKDHPFE
jgi:putative pyruvate formate lyase activating enzyme